MAGIGRGELSRTRPPQIENLLDEIRNCVEEGNFRFSKHAIKRRKERHISPQDALYVLKTGYHEKKKTTYTSTYQTWKYAIRGKTNDNKTIRVICAIVKEMIVITVIDLEKK